MNEITIGDKVYISAKRAAEITGYARDYVGQLCREGHVDAKMVGRSWYVYEPSIRAHRFGPEAVSPQAGAATADAMPEEPVVAEEKPSVEPVQENKATASEWQTPKYSAESPELLPELTPASLEALLPPPEETLTDMQAAWREWFEQKQNVLETPEIESPEVIDARNEAYEEAHEVEEASEEAIEESEAEEVVAIHHIPAAPEPVYSSSPAPRMDISREASPVRQEMAPQSDHGRVISERIVTKKRKRTRTKRTAGRSNAPIVAMLIGISFVAIAVAVIGTGYASRYLKTLPAENNPVINFLVGTQKFSR